jgi:hypothetical protein
VVNADTIKSPGGPIPPITLEQMRSFSSPMIRSAGVGPR